MESERYRVIRLLSQNLAKGISIDIAGYFWYWGVMHDVKVAGVENFGHGEISAETVRVGANNQNQIDGKTVYDCGGAYEVVGQTLQEQSLTEKYDWGISRSLSGG